MKGIELVWRRWRNARLEKKQRRLDERRRRLRQKAEKVLARRMANKDKLARLLNDMGIKPGQTHTQHVKARGIESGEKVGDLGS